MPIAPNALGVTWPIPRKISIFSDIFFSPVTPGWWRRTRNRFAFFPHPKKRRSDGHTASCRTNNSHRCPRLPVPANPPPSVRRLPASPLRASRDRDVPQRQVAVFGVAPRVRERVLDPSRRSSVCARDIRVTLQNEMYLIVF